MVAPITNSVSNPAQPIRQQATIVPLKANPQPAQASANRTSAKPPVTIDLASANSQPNANLPRGSIVDRLV